MLVRIVGFDPAFANFGIARTLVDTTTFRIAKIEDLKLVKTEKAKNKTVRASSDELARARILQQEMASACTGCLGAAMEVPAGSQSASAARKLGIAVGVMASCPLPMIEVSPIEGKKASVGKKTATKQEMIDWATGRWPNAPWIEHRGKLTQANEHLADACAVVEAALLTQELRMALGVAAQATG